MVFWPSPFWHSPGVSFVFSHLCCRADLLTALITQLIPTAILNGCSEGTCFGLFPCLRNAQWRGLAAITLSLPPVPPFFSRVAVTLSGSQHHAGLRKLMNMILLCLCLSLLAAFLQLLKTWTQGSYVHTAATRIRPYCVSVVTYENVLWS